MSARTEPAVVSSDLEALAVRARRSIVELGHEAGGTGAHYGPALSLVEVMAAIYATSNVVETGMAEVERDRVILSKGHGSLALYCVLHEFGVIDHAVLRTAEKDGSRLPGQPIRDPELGVEFSSGSLGMGLSFGLGLAMSARMSGGDRRIFVIMGDGETNEGSVWEAAMAAAHHRVDNLVAIVDVNDLQSDGPTSQIMNFDHARAWQGFGWEIVEVDGHSTTELMEALGRRTAGSPLCVLAHTVKGKGVSFMEGVSEWHHGRLTEDQFEQARRELSGGTS